MEAVPEPIWRRKMHPVTVEVHYYLMLVGWLHAVALATDGEKLHALINLSFFVSAGYAQTDTDWSVNMGSTCAASASDSTLKTSASWRQVLYLLSVMQDLVSHLILKCKTHGRGMPPSPCPVPNSFATLSVLVDLQWVFLVTAGLNTWGWHVRRWIQRSPECQSKWNNSALQINCFLSNLQVQLCLLLSSCWVQQCESLGLEMILALHPFVN